MHAFKYGTKRLIAAMDFTLIRRWWLVTLAFILAFQNVGVTQTALWLPTSGVEQPNCTGTSCPEEPRAAGDPRGTAAQRQPAPVSPNTLGAQPAPVSPNTLGVQPPPGQPFGQSQLPPVLPEPPLAPTEFQEFVAGSIGRKLPIYGVSLFDRVPTTFAPIDRIPVTADYVIGPGDELLIRAWGQIDLDAKVMVDRSGDIYLPKVGAISVAGIKYQQAQEYLKSAVGRVFRNFDLNVNLGQLRSIQVFVVGQARRPGTYTVSSLSTLVNALFASGGPSPSGSMRHIQLKRNNHVVTDFDFYDLLLNGDKSKDVRLLPGDVIYIPPVGPQVAVAGSVNLPAIYELRDRPSFPENLAVADAKAEIAAAREVKASAIHELHTGTTSLGDVIDMAGGLTSTADGQKVSVERIENHTTRRVEEFPLDQDGWSRELKDGDLVRVFSLSPRFENAVTLRGNVARSGRYAWHPNMHILDLIPDQNALVTREYWRANNALITPMGLREYDRERSRPGSDDRQNDERSSKASTASTTSELRNDIKHRAPEINWEYAVVQRLNPQDLTTHLIPFNLGKAVLEKDAENNLELQPGDIVTIFSQADLAVAREKQTKFVRLEGELRTGVYRVEPGETLRQLVARTGGLTRNSYLYGAEFTRESVREQQQKGLDQLVESLERDTARNALAPTMGNTEDANEKRSQLEAQRQLVEKLRQAKATGRIVLNLQPHATGLDALPEMPLEDGDRLVVPSRPSTIGVLGAVYSKNSFLYRPNERLSWYLRQAGGETREADKGRTFVIRADGSVVSKQSVGRLWTGSFDALRLMPGDTIIVPERLNRGATLKAIRDWSQVFTQFALGAAAVNVIK